MWKHLKNVNGWAPKNWCFWTVVLEKTLESPLDCKEIQPVHSEDQPWDFFGRNDDKSWNSSTLATSCEELTHWKRLWCWEGLGAGGGGDDRGWDGWMASLTRWTWVWVNSGTWWCYLNISSSVAPLSSSPEYFPAQYFQCVSSSHQVAKILEFHL